MATKIKKIKRVKRVSKRKKRKRRYLTGVHTSPKCLTPIKYRSSWEKVACVHFDNDPKVIKYEYESVKIPYVSNKRTGKLLNYIPDFIVEYFDGTKVIIEIKREDKLNNIKVLQKAEAARLWAEKQNMSYLFWTQTVILPLKKLYKI